MTIYRSLASGGWSTSTNWTPTGVPGNGDRVFINHAVTIDQDIGTVGGGGIGNIILATTLDAPGRLLYDGASAASSYTITIGSTSNAVGAEVGTCSAWTYTPVGTPASTPGVTVSGFLPRTLSQSWTLTCTTGGTGTASRWTVTGSLTGVGNTNVPPGADTTVPNTFAWLSEMVINIAVPGANGYQVGDTFTATTTEAQYRGIWDGGSGSTEPFHLVGTAARGLTIQAANADGDHAIYFRHGDPGVLPATGVTLTFVFVTFNDFGSKQHLEPNRYLGILEQVEHVSITDCTFRRLGALYLAAPDSPVFSRNTFLDPRGEAVYEGQALFQSNCKYTGNLDQGLYDSNVLLSDSVGRHHACFMRITGGDGGGSVITNNAMYPTGTNTGHAWWGLQAIGGSVTKPSIIANNYMRPLGPGVLSVVLGGEGVGVIGIDAQGYLDMHDNVFEHFTLYEFEQGCQGRMYRNKFINGLMSGVFLKHSIDTLLFHDNLVICQRGTDNGCIFVGGEGHTDLRIYNNTCIIQGPNYGILISAGSPAPQTVTLYNNIFVQTGPTTGGIGIYDSGGTNVFPVPPDYNLCFGFNAFASASSPTFGTHPNTHELTSNPLLASVDPTSSVCGQLLVGSPAINAGLETADTLAVVLDLFQHLRHLGGIDLGAHEFGAGVPPVEVVHFVTF